MSILERQRVIFERLYQCQQQQQQISNTLPNQNLVQFNSLISSEHTMEFSQFQNFPINIDTQMEFGRGQGNVASSEFTNNSLELSNSSITRMLSKKRKTEFFEEDDRKAKKHEGEAVEVKSEMIVKSEVKSEMIVKSEKGKNSKKNLEVKRTDYIHVRARRGQATDSHSLAERARREKISKKMKCLQDLVPGCNKVIGKAGMLDEIINYVQSLQKQVEFLSIKLAASNLNTDSNLFANEFPNPTCSQNNNLVQQQQGVSQMLQQRRENCTLMSFPEAFLDSSHVLALQQLPNFETDLQCHFGLGFQQ